MLVFWMTILGLIFIVAFIIIILISRPLYQGPVSDHFNGQKFFYKEYDHSYKDMLKWALEMKVVRWPKWITDPPRPKPEPDVAEGEIKVTYINHGTLLIQLDGVNILTDPLCIMGRLLNTLSKALMHTKRI